MLPAYFVALFLGACPVGWRPITPPSFTIIIQGRPALVQPMPTQGEWCEYQGRSQR